MDRPMPQWKVDAWTKILTSPKLKLMLENARKLQEEIAYKVIMENKNKNPIA